MTARALVVRCGAFGDVVMATTMIRLLGARYGSPVDVIGSGGWTPALLRNEPALGHLQMLTSRNTPYLFCPSQWALVRWLRRRGRGPVYLCDTNPRMRDLLDRGRVHRDDIVERLPSDDERDGVTQLWPDRWISMGQRNPPHAYPVHDVDASAYRLPRLIVTDADRQECARWRGNKRLQGPLVLFQPGNKRTHKRGSIATRQHPKFWPPGCWAEVAQAVWSELPDAQVLLCGSPLEHAVLEEIRTASGDDPRMHNLARELPIPRLLALIEQAHSMVSVDTGPAHAAAALGCPLVVLFGAASPQKWRPLGPGTILTLGGEKGDESRVSDIPVESVIAGWQGL